MSTSNKTTAEGDNAADASTRPPAGLLTLDQHDGSLVMRRKENTHLGFAFLSIAALFIINVSAVVIAKRPAMTITGFAVLVAIGAVLVFFGVAMLVQVTTISVSEKELVITRGPLPFSSTKRLPTDQIVGLQLTFITSIKSGRTTYRLSAVPAEGRPKRLLKFSGLAYDETARYCMSLLSERLGVPVSKKTQQG